MVSRFQKRNIPLIGMISLTGLAFLGLMVPAWISFAQSAWQRPENAHAPFLLAIIVAIMVTRLRHVPLSTYTLAQIPYLEVAILLIIGGQAYFFGRVEEIELILSLSQIPLAIAVILILGGWALLRLLWFPIALLAYLIIWPGWFVDGFTGPLKIWISATATTLLSNLGLPVANSGVLIAVGSYELFIADACAGLNSLVALTALGAVYLYFVRKQGWRRNAVLFMAMFPIAIIANLCRVLMLILITHYGGYNLGQVFMHEIAGLFMFALALLFVFALDEFWRRPPSLSVNGKKAAMI
ncbi:MAG: exosortase/archaeosortase family protein [bacterium]